MAGMLQHLPDGRVDAGSSQGRAEPQPPAEEVRHSPVLGAQRETGRHTCSKGPVCGLRLKFCRNQGEASWRAPWRRWGLRGCIGGTGRANSLPLSDGKLDSDQGLCGRSCLEPRRGGQVGRPEGSQRPPGAARGGSQEGLDLSPATHSPGPGLLRPSPRRNGSSSLAQTVAAAAPARWSPRAGRWQPSG